MENQKIKLDGTARRRTVPSRVVMMGRMANKRLGVPRLPFPLAEHRSPSMCSHFFSSRGRVW